MSTVEFFAPGLPMPAGSKRAYIIHGEKRGQFRARAVVTDASGARGRQWRTTVQHAARERLARLSSDVRAELWDGALALELVFIVPRPKGHNGKHGLRASAPAYPTTRPDVDKLSRAVMDSLSQVVYRDDAQVVWKLAQKVYGTSPGARIGIRLA